MLVFVVTKEIEDGGESRDGYPTYTVIIEAVFGTHQQALDFVEERKHSDGYYEIETHQVL